MVRVFVIAVLKKESVSQKKKLIANNFSYQWIGNHARVMNIFAVCFSVPHPFYSRLEFYSYV